MALRGAWVEHEQNKLALRGMSRIADLSRNDHCDTNWCVEM